MLQTLLGLLVVVGQTIAIYAFLVVGLSRVGRRSMAQLTLIEYAIIALLGSAVETGLYSGSGALLNGLVSAASLLASNRALTLLARRWPALRRFLVGVPIVLVHDGQLVRPHLRQACLTEQDVLEAIRRRGYDRLDDVRLAVLEVNGTIGVVPR